MRGRRLQRLLKIIPLLKSGTTSYNARRLANQFQCSLRNIYRDMAVLELSGVPFYYDPEWGEGGGYRIRSEWWFPQVGLTDQECFDLAVLSRVAEKRSIPLLENVSTARDKLVGTLPSKQQDLIRSASELYDILGLHMANHGHCRPVMEKIQTALLQRRQLEGRYRGPHQNNIVRVSLQPRRVFLAGQAWYVVAYDNKDRRTKLYRIPRFVDLRVLDKGITVDPAFSLREFLGNAWMAFKGERDYHIELHFAPEVAEMVAETTWHQTQELERLADGSVLFRVTVSGLQEIVWWILGWGPRVKVLKPKELAEVVCSLACKVVDQYQQQGKGRRK